MDQIPTLFFPENGEPGFGSAARFEAIMFSEVVRDTMALRYTEKVKIVETMGRNSGWLTAAAAMAGDYAPDLIYVPELPFNRDKFLADVETVYKAQGYVVIAACEGLKNPDGTLVAANQDACPSRCSSPLDPGSPRDRALPIRRTEFLSRVFARTR